MGWWASVVKGTKITGYQLTSSAQWVWEKASLSKVTSSLFTYTSDTTFHIMEEGLALRKAIPTLFTNSEVKKFMGGVNYVLINDVLPLVSLNYVNNKVQNYFRADHEEDRNLSLYSAFLGVLTLTNYAVIAYTWRQGTQTFVRVAVLDSFGPAAFNSTKIIPPPSLCIEFECNAKRQIKGMGRELFILLANEALIGGISYLPYAGTRLSEVLTVINNGRYITRLVTPERCERHKLMKQESVLALGLTYEASSRLMDYALESSIGPLPYLYLRVLHHFLLSFHVNLAAHMTIPLVEPKDASLPFDLFNGYERAWRFILDVIFAGLIKRVPIDFKPERGAAPLIPLSPVLQFGTRLFNSDLEKERRDVTSPWTQTVTNATLWIVPPIFHSAEHFIRDPIISRYWQSLQQGAISTVDLIQSIHKNKKVSAFSWAPKSVAVVLDLKFGIPQQVTKVLIMLSKEKDFWDLANAIKSWFERHHLMVEVKLVRKSSIALHGEQIIEEPPLTLEDNSINEVPAVVILPEKPLEQVINAAELFSERRKTPSIAMASISPDALFSTRQRKPRKEDAGMQSAALGHAP